MTKSFQELSKVIPSFIRRSEPEHRHHRSFVQFTEAMRDELKVVTEQHTHFSERTTKPGVRLISSDPDAVTKVTSALLFQHSNKGLEDLVNYCAKLPEEEIEKILDTASNARENRRQKSPRALEHASFTFEIIADYGIYRDLQRHRILTQEHQLLNCDYSYFIPEEVLGTELEKDYVQAMEKGKEVYDLLSAEFPEEAQYVVPMAYNTRWYFHLNLRALQWLCELRSSPQGHPNYRFVAQEMARQVTEAFPAFERFLKFVDYEGHELGRIGQEQRKVEKSLASSPV